MNEPRNPGTVDAVDRLPSRLAVLASGGLDSAILLGELAGRQRAVHPLYIRGGLAWEDVEISHLRRFLERLDNPALAALTLLDLPVRDLYGAHWSITGRGVPDAASPDEAVFLPGRNLLLLAKAMLWCHLHGVPGVALAPLKGNPFPDATADFFSACENTLNRAVSGQVAIYCPYADLGKAEVMRRGRGLPLELTFSCIRPQGGRHCGRCNKCAERRRAFRAAGLVDRTEYSEDQPCTA